MNKELKEDKKQDVIEIWKPSDVAQLELRRGFGVARPVPRHWHEEYQLCLIQSGAGELNYRGSTLPTPPASLFMIYPGEVHSNRAFDDFGCSYRTMFLDAALMRSAIREMRGKDADLPFFPTAVTFDKDIIRQYVNLHLAFEQISPNLERHTLLLNFLTTLITRFAENRPALRSFGIERQNVGCACDYLIENYNENISLENLARQANLSPFYFNRVFSEEFGMPPHAFQTQIRVFKAKALLQQGWSISKAASQTGFADQSHLNRHFKRLVGVTPGQYKRDSKNVHDLVN